MGVRAVVLAAGSVVCLLLVAVPGCTLDRTPEPWGDRRSATVAGAPVRDPNETPSDDIFGPRPTPGTGDAPMATVGGLQCGGIFCPFTQEPIRPCCTTAQDVERGSAREGDRCGLDFTETSGDFFGDACWQRDQLGVPDTTCPGLALQPGLEEPGCCTEQGLCGGMNSGQAIGCHYSLDAEPAPCGEEVDETVTCEPLGVFGVRTTVDVAWGGRSGGLVGLTDDGRERIVIHLMIRLEKLEADNSVRGTVRPCGVQLPPFYSTTLCESYRPVFPDRIWESVAVPEYPLSGRYQCLHPGCILTLDALTALLGISLDNPEAPWPSPQQTPTVSCPEGMGMSCFPDIDEDDLPGLTIELHHEGSAPSPGGGTCPNGYAYRGAPLSASPAAIFGGVRRTDRMFLGTRTKLGGSGKIADDCNSGVGAGIAEFVQSRAWGCYVQEGTFNFGTTSPAGPDEFCMAPEAAFVDENLPIYQILNVGQAPDPALQVEQAPSEGSQFSLVRLGDLGDRVGCTDVRNAPYR